MHCTNIGMRFGGKKDTRHIREYVFFIMNCTMALQEKERGTLKMAEVTSIFNEIDDALKEDPSRTKGIEATYQFDLDEGDSVYQLVLNGADSYSTEGEKETPDCTLKMAAEDFEKMARGNPNGTQAFMSGKLKIKGNMGLALKLQDILASYNSATQ